MKLYLNFLFISILASCFALNDSAFSQKLTDMPDPKFKVRLEKSHLISMRDGVELSTDLYFPEKAGDKLPVILIRTPYNKKSWRVGEHSSETYMFASQGFVVAVQDTRGKFESEGIFTPAGGDAKDGFDTIDWLARQSWCNGKVGTYGCSYAGEIQIYQAPLRHPNLAAMIPQASGGAVGAANGRYRYMAAFKDGVFRFGGGVRWMFKNGCKYSLKPPSGLTRTELLKIVDYFEPSPVYLPEVDFKELCWSFNIGNSFLALLQIPHNFPQYPPTDILKQDYHFQTDSVKDSKSDTNPTKSTNHQV